MREALMHYVTLPALAGAEQARCRGDESSQGFSPEAQARCVGCAALLAKSRLGRLATAIGSDLWRSLAFANVPQRLLPKNSPTNSPWELNHWNCWRSLGDSNPCFRRERAG